MKRLQSLALASLVTLALPLDALAGGCAPGEPCWEDPPKRMADPKPAPAVVPPPAPVEEEPVVMERKEEVMMKEEEGKLHIGLSAGVTVMMFDCEDTKVGPALYVDVMHDDMPLNLRAGVEGVDLEDSEQYKYTPSSQYFQQEPDFALIRLPLSLEYVIGLAEKTELMLGGGPDLLVLTGEDTDTTVGLHLGARVRQALTDSLGVSVSGGYMWGEADIKNDEHYDLDSAYVGADVSYRF